jgi:hypothetical protein
MDPTVVKDDDRVLVVAHRIINIHFGRQIIDEFNERFSIEATINHFDM